MKNCIRCLGIAAALVLLVGCAQNDPYHTKAGTPNNCVADPAASDCLTSYYQQYENYDVGFAEFSDRGNAFDDQYIDNVLQRIEEQADPRTGPGVVVITFVHGWKHNADESDKNLIDFKESLNEIVSSGTLRGRRLIGVYVGWRGVSVDLPLLKDFSFWERKTAATEVGKGSVTRLLLELDRIDVLDTDNVFVVVGHSFGGAIVVSALTEVLTARVVERSKQGNYARTLGDAVIVLNPATEANQALDLVEAALKEDFSNEQQPIFVSISTDADTATHMAFPLGQTVGLLLTWRQKDLKRAYLVDRRAPSRDQVLQEEHLDATTVGNFAPFLTHRLTFRELDNEKGAFEFAPCEEVPEECTPKGFTTLSGQPTIRQYPRGYPLFFIKTDEHVMSGHNDIFNERIKAFMLTLINDVVRSEIREAVAGDFAVPARLSILREPKNLIKESEAFYQRLKESVKTRKQ